MRTMAVLFLLMTCCVWVVGPIDPFQGEQVLDGNYYRQNISQDPRGHSDCLECLGMGDCHPCPEREGK